MFRARSALILAVAAALTAPADAATIQDAGFTDSTYVTGLSAATAMAWAPDGRLFIAQQTGALRVVKNGTLLATPFLTVTVDSNNERGLVGVTLDPNFASNGWVYVYYTTPANGTHNRLSRWTAAGDVAAAGSELILVELPPLSTAANHNGGALHFGNDGKLYVAVGENANGALAQDMTTPLGKLLRFNPDGTIPTDDPFYSSTSGLARAIWALGLRNPFTFAIRRSTGAIMINDVGNSGWEEVNAGQAGANYGWPATEGATTNPAYKSPLYAYPHAAGTAGGCAITGAEFYDPPTPQFPTSYVGMFFFADYCNSWMGKLDPATGTTSLFATAIDSVVDIDVGPDAALYYLSHNSGKVGRIAYNVATPPTITSQPGSTTIALGESATFSVSATGTLPFSYQWQRNGVAIAGATSVSYTLSNAQAADNGAQFRCVVTNTYGSATSNAATLTVTNNHRPTATITTPAAGATYTGGMTLNFAGTGSDVEDGNLTPSAFTWTIVFHHDTHTHPGMPDTSGIASGSWPLSDSGHTETNVWFRVWLTVRDSGGLTAQTYRDVTPVLTTFTVASSPSGLQLTLDGPPVTTPYTANGVVNVPRVLGAPSPQAINGETWLYNFWSDGGGQTHTIYPPATAQTYTATYADGGANTNLALGKPVTASSSENAGTGPNLAVDGSAATRWSSGFSDPQWIRVDLGAVAAITSVKLNWEAAYAKAYQVQVSNDDANWSTVVNIATGDGGVDVIPVSTNGRYVRMWATARSGAYGDSLWEFEVWGSRGGSSTPTPTATARTTATVTATPTAVSGGNLALGKPVFASSAENAGTAATNAVDGNAGTRWSSAFADPQWIFVDLGSVTSITRVRLNWEAAYGKAYQIQTSSDSVNWATIKDVPAGVGGIEDWTGLSGSGRYVRMYGTARASAYGYSLWELEVYGTGGATATLTPTASATPTPTTAATATATSATAMLLSQGHTVTASSVENAGTAAANAVDGNMGTRWSSTFADPQWIFVDLGASHALSRVVLTWEAAYGKAFQVQSSPDAVNWANLYQTTTGTGGTNDLAVSGSGRYVRMYGTARATAYGYSLWELQVYGQ